MRNLVAALIKSQKEIKNAVKDAKNPHLKNTYATLESVIDAVKEIANSNGMAIVQVQGKDEMGDFVETMLIHDSGEQLNSKCYLTLDKLSMQGLGSAITYARRYSLASMFCITQEDDDGNSSPTISEPKNYRNTDINKFSAPERNLNNYVIPVGKFLNRRLGDLSNKELTDYMNYVANNNQKIDGKLKEFLDTAREYLATT